MYGARPSVSGIPRSCGVTYGVRASPRLGGLGHLDWSDVATPAHQQLALESARQSMVRAADVLGIDCASC